MVGVGGKGVGDCFGHQIAFSGVRFPCRPQPAYDDVLSLLAPSVCVLARGTVLSYAPLPLPAFALLFGWLQLVAFALVLQPRPGLSAVRFQHRFPIVPLDLIEVVAVGVGPVAVVG